jgi:hypothetical protein
MVQRHSEGVWKNNEDKTNKSANYMDKLHFSLGPIQFQQENTSGQFLLR